MACNTQFLNASRFILIMGMALGLNKYTINLFWGKNVGGGGAIKILPMFEMLEGILSHPKIRGFKNKYVKGQ